LPRSWFLKNYQGFDSQKGEKHMAKVTFYPLGNADSALIEFDDDRLMLNDYFCPESFEEGDKRIDLSEELQKVLDSKDRDYFDIVAFSHRDNDHVGGADKFFKMENPDIKKSGDIAIKNMWVPAFFILEKGLDCSAEIIQKEARYRLKKAKNIRVMGSSDKLTEWIDKNCESPSLSKTLIVPAGKTVEDSSEVKIFVHSPFSAETDIKEGDPNDASMVLHFTFKVSNTKAMFGADLKAETWNKLIKITEKKNNEAHLEWDIFKVSHHCSYLSLNTEGNEGTTKTEPLPSIDKMFKKGNNKSYLISSSWPRDYDKEPPHKQAVNYYDDLDGTFLITMEEPNKRSPKPIEFEISDRGHRKLLVGAGGVIPSIASKASSKQGRK
jgi:hypothetical protein